MRGAVDALQHVGAHVSDALVNHTEGACGFSAEIENAAAIEWAAIVYCHNDAAADRRRVPNGKVLWAAVSPAPRPE